MTDKIREDFSKEVWSDTVWEGCGPTALDIFTAGYQARDRELRTALTTARDALCLPCDRWNKTQFQIIQNAIAAIDAAMSEAK